MVSLQRGKRPAKKLEQPGQNRRRKSQQGRNTGQQIRGGNPALYCRKAGTLLAHRETRSRRKSPGIWDLHGPSLKKINRADTRAQPRVSHSKKIRKKAVGDAKKVRTGASENSKISNALRALQSKSPDAHMAFAPCRKSRTDDRQAGMKQNRNTGKGPAASHR